jgi:hypothetical protein
MPTVLWYSRTQPENKVAAHNAYKAGLRISDAQVEQFKLNFKKIGNVPV